MRKFLIVPLALALVACAGSPAQQVLETCEAHDTAVRTFAPLVAAGLPSQSQVDAVDRSILTADGICDGTVTDFTGALRVINAELMRLAIIQAGGQ